MTRDEFITSILPDQPLEDTLKGVELVANVYDLDQRPLTAEDLDAIFKHTIKSGFVVPWNVELVLLADKDLVLDIDTMLASFNANYEGAVSYGTFENKGTTIDWGFQGFRRGRYEMFYTLYPEIKSGGLIVPVGDHTNKLNHTYLKR